MTAKIHFVLFLLITLFTETLLSQSSGWEIVYQLPSYQQTIYEVQFVNNSTGFAGSWDTKLYKTTNAGLNWVIYNHHSFNNNDAFNSIFFFNAQTGFIGGDYGRLYKTTDGGVSLDTLYPGGGDHFHSICFPSRDTGYLATKYGGLLKTIDGGDSWIIQQQPLSTGYRFEGLSAPSNEVVFATGNRFYNQPYFQIYRTTNGGLYWEGIRVDSVDWVYGVYFVNVNTGYIACESQAGYPNSYYVGKVLKTTNGGFNWTLKLSDSASIYRSVQFINQNTGFVVGMSNSSFAKTTDAGETWNIYRSYLFGGLWTVYFIDANTGVAAGDYRIIRTTNGGEPIGIKSISTKIPKVFSLSQNCPNPFNPNSKIKFQIPKSSIVKLVVYNILGKEVQTLVNENLSPGIYEVSFDGSNLSSGVYFYRLQADDYINTRKMVLLK